MDVEPKIVIITARIRVLFKFELNLDVPSLCCRPLLQNGSARLNLTFTRSSPDMFRNICRYKVLQRKNHIFPKETHLSIHTDRA